MIDTIIDLNHDNSLDFAKVQAAGIVAIIHKATEGATFQDDHYQQRKKIALQMGFLWGAYHFSSGKPPKDQVANFLKMEDGKDPNVLLALDWEDSTSGKNMTLKQAREFVERIADKVGRFPVIYGGHLIRENVGDEKDEVLAKCPLWYVRYKSKPEGIPTSTWPTFTLWQYTDGKKGPEPHETPGASGADRNRFDGTEAQLKKQWPFT